MREHDDATQPETLRVFPPIGALDEETRRQQTATKAAEWQRRYQEQEARREDPAEVVGIGEAADYDDAGAPLLDRLIDEGDLVVIGAPRGDRQVFYRDGPRRDPGGRSPTVRPVVVLSGQLHTATQGPCRHRPRRSETEPTDLRALGRSPRSGRRQGSVTASGNSSPVRTRSR